MSLFWIIFSYILGSFPSGYLISRFSGKNILEIGWRKTSGSNVFKNVGKWRGALTGILDLGKGYLAVFGAQKLGFSLEVQIFSGVAAVTGHNWSIFLKFAGGRGIGTFIGAFLAISPKILGFSLVPLVLLALVWDAAIGTLLFLATAIIISIYLGQFEIEGLFTVLSLAPILIKRLSPIKEIFRAENPAIIFSNRLLFDDDKANLELRIKKIFWVVKRNSHKATAIMKPLTGSLLYPPKVGWKAAKYGVKMAKKPIEKLLGGQEKIVTEIYPEDLKRMMISATRKIVFHQEEINKINVFPVADKDTGYNLAATLLGVEGTISRKEYLTFRELAKDIKESAMTNARGNAGMIYTGYLMELLDRIKHLELIDAFHLSLAMQKGIKAARFSIAEPVEGTILDVIKAAGEKAFEIARFKKEKNIIKVLEEALKFSEIALKETKEKLKVLKENDVVDAGALGFVKILEAWVESLKGIPINSKTEVTSPIIQPETEEKPSTRAEIGVGLEYQYEVVLSFKKTEGTNVAEIKQELSLLGGSLDIIESEDKIKLHIHTNQPEEIQGRFKDFPSLEFRVEDMEKQLTPHQILVEGKKEPLGLIVGETASLPKEFLEKYNIEEIHFTARFPGGEIIASKEEIYPKMREAIKTGRPLPTTSAPSFKEFFSAYQRAFEKFEKILVITVSSKISGTYSSARIARSFLEKPAKLNIFVFDCFAVEVAEGLVAIKAQELISQGKKMEEVVEELKEFCPKVTLLICFDDFRYIIQGGRLRLPKILVKPISLVQKIGVRLIATLKDGKVKILGVRFGRNIAETLAKEVERQRKGREIRAAIAQADNLEAAEELKKLLEKKSGIKVLFVSSVSSAIGTHTGPGTLLVAFHPVDN